MPTTLRKLYYNNPITTSTTPSTTTAFAKIWNSFVSTLPTTTTIATTTTTTKTTTTVPRSFLDFRSFNNLVSNDVVRGMWRN